MGSAGVMRVLLAACAFAAALSAQSPTEASAQASALATKLIDLHRAWGPAMNSPGASIQLKEMSRSGNAIRFRAYVTGLPHDAVYTAVQWPVTMQSPTATLNGVTLDEAGLAICAGKPGTCGDPKNPNDPIDFVVTPVKGEPFRFGLVSGKELKAFVKIVPNPNQASDKGCNLDTVLLMPKGEVVLIEGTGFKPGVKLTVTQTSENESHDGAEHADSDGKFSSVTLPFVQGRQSVISRVTAKSAECAPSLNFHWGPQ